MSEISGRPYGGSATTMNQDDRDTMRDEYDFSEGVRGKHHEAYRKGTNVVLLEGNPGALGR